MGQTNRHNAFGLQDGIKYFTVEKAKAKGQ